MVAAAQRSSTDQITREAVARATLPLALVALAGAVVWAFGVTQVLLVASHHLTVAATATLLLHLLSAGLTGPSVAAHATGV